MLECTGSNGSRARRGHGPQSRRSTLKPFILTYGSPVYVSCCLQTRAHENVFKDNSKIQAVLVFVFQAPTHLLLHCGTVVF